jgi:hypothetical protein
MAVGRLKCLESEVRGLEEVVAVLVPSWVAGVEAILQEVFVLAEMEVKAEVVEARALHVFH